MLDGNFAEIAEEEPRGNLSKFLKIDHTEKEIKLPLRIWILKRRLTP